MTKKRVQQNNTPIRSSHMLLMHAEVLTTGIPRRTKMGQNERNDPPSSNIANTNNRKTTRIEEGSNENNVMVSISAIT